MGHKQVVLNGKDLTINQLVDIANDSKGEVEVCLGNLAKWRITEARQNVEKEIAKGNRYIRHNHKNRPREGKVCAGGP